MKAWKPKYRWFHIPANGLRNWIRCFASTCNNAAPTPATTETIATVTKPFVLYESERVTVYQGDCRDVIATMDRDAADLIVTDPPYGVKARSSSKRKKQDKFTPIIGDDDKQQVIKILAECAHPLRSKRHVYVFGFRPDELKEPMSLGGCSELIWDKQILGMGGGESPLRRQHAKICFGLYVDSLSK